METLQHFITILIPLVIIMDPLGNLPFFLLFTEQNTLNEKRKMAAIASLAAGLILIFGKMIFRGGVSVVFNKKAAALFERAFRGPGKMVHIELGIRPYSHGCERAAVRVSQKNHRTAYPFKHATLQRQPALTECLGCGCPDKLLPE